MCVSYQRSILYLSDFYRVDANMIGLCYIYAIRKNWIQLSMNSNYKIDLDSLRVIEAIVEQGSFTGASVVLHRVPSTISYTISKLESSFNVNFFERKKQGVRLTEAGKELVRHSRHLLQVAEDTQRSIERIANGWEAELRITLGDLVNPNAVLPLFEGLLKQSPKMQISINVEVLNGVWDSLAANRADIVIGAEASIPENLGAVSTFEMGYFDFVFAVAADHPLTKIEEPLSHDDVKPYHVVAVADTARNIPHRSIGLLEGQAVLTVPDHKTKMEAQRLGLGVGTVARQLVQPYLDDKSLVIKTTEMGSVRSFPVIVAWKKSHKGKGLQWLVEQLRRDEIKKQLLDLHL